MDAALKTLLLYYCWPPPAARDSVMLCRLEPLLLTLGQMLAEPNSGLLVFVSYRQGSAQATAPLEQCSS